MSDRLRLASAEGARPDCILAGPTPVYSISGDLFATRPDPEHYPRSAEAWPARAERVVAAWNALDGHDMADFDNLVADALKWRAAQLTKQLELI